MKTKLTFFILSFFISGNLLAQIVDLTADGDKVPMAGKTLTVAEVLQNKKIVTNNPEYKIATFSIAVNKDGYEYEEKSSSENITDGMRKLIEKLSPGAKFYCEKIQYVKYVRSDTVYLDVPPFVTTIK